MIFALLVFLGWRSGALRQGIRVVAVIAVLIGVPFVSPIIRSILFGESGRAAPGVEVMSIIGAGILIFATITVAGWFAIRVMRTISSTLGKLDRLGGAVVGAIFASVVVYFLAVVVVFSEGPLSERDPDDNMRLREGWLVSAVGEYNVLAPWQFPDLDRLHQALRVGALVESNGAYERARADQDLSTVLRDDRFKALLADEGLMAWVSEGNYPLTLADARVRELLNDEEMAIRLKLVDWSELIAELDSEDSQAIVTDLSEP